MIKFNFFIALLLINFSSFAKNNLPEFNLDSKVDIQILNIITNGQILSNNIINFNGVEDLDIEFDVKISYTGINSKYINEGVLNCYYYDPNTFDNEIASNYNNGVNPLYLFQKDNIKLESSNSIYTYTFHQKLRFKKSIAFNSGSSIVFRYRTNTLSTDISNKLTFKFVGGTKTGSEPYKSAIANVNLTNITYSDGTPIVNNKIIVPDFEGDEIGTRSINLSFNYNCIYGTKLPSGYYPGFVIQIARDQSGSTNLTDWTYPIFTNGTLTFNDLKIKSTDITPNTKLRILFNFQEVKLDLQFAIAQTAKPIIYNTISNNQTLNLGQVSKPFTYNTPYADYTIRDPSHSSSRPIYDFRYITLFKWQTKTQNSDWTDIPGQTSISYSPNKTFTENTSYRRIAYYDGQYNISNTVSITLNNPNLQNTICCNQNSLPANAQPQEIVGNASNLDNLTYQWQICKQPTSTIPVWTDIKNATNQNYKHTFTEAAIRGTGNTAFRRLLNKNSFTVSTSNQINIQRIEGSIVGTTRISNNIDITENDEISKDTNLLKIYPNPINDYFIVEGEININDISIYDSFGKKLDVSKKQTSNNSIQVDVTKLISGIFILKVDNTNFSKTLLKN